MNIRFSIGAAVMMLVLGGCATSPEDVSQNGERFDYTTPLTPYAASICIARNARSYSAGSSGEERLLGKSSTEVVMRAGGDTLATAQIHTSDSVMSKVTIWVSRSVRSDRQSIAKHLMIKC